MNLPSFSGMFSLVIVRVFSIAFFFQCCFSNLKNKHKKTLMCVADIILMV